MEHYPGVTTADVGKGPVGPIAADMSGIVLAFRATQGSPDQCFLREDVLGGMPRSSQE